MMRKRKLRCLTSVVLSIALCGMSVASANAADLGTQGTEQGAGKVDAVARGLIKKDEKLKVQEERKKFFASEAQILLVDDSEQNIQVITSLLRRTGVQLDTAASGFECIEKVRNKKYHLIFLDYLMKPVMKLVSLQMVSTILLKHYKILW